jgi:hypothetical protein
MRSFTFFRLATTRMRSAGRRETRGSPAKCVW